jgi:FkbM family methyltransferase
MFHRILEAFASRRLFHNWLSAAITYWLWEKGILKVDCIRVVCKKGKNDVCIEPSFYGRIVRGYYIGYTKDVYCEDAYLVLNGLRLLSKPVFNGVFWDLGLAKFVNLRSVEVFLKQPYSSANVTGRTVVDVGAFVGDSAIYFVLRGAKKVIAIEPHPGAYQEMLENVRLNNMGDRIIPVNAGLASKPGLINIENLGIDQTLGIYYRPGLTGSIRAITLEELIEQFNIDPSDTVLKMDCEGCEYDVVLNDYKHVKLFRELIMEYHEDENRHSTDIVKLLSGDYDCQFIKETRNVGILHCIKRRR